MPQAVPIHGVLELRREVEDAFGARSVALPRLMTSGAERSARIQVTITARKRTEPAFTRS
jgi:hypothetical protein